MIWIIKKTAYELFFKTGPLAILPMKSNYTKKFCSSIIWSDNSEYLNSLQNISNNLLKSIIEEKVQYYAIKSTSLIFKLLELRQKFIELKGILDTCFILVNLSSSTALNIFPFFNIQAEESGCKALIPRTSIF